MATRLPEFDELVDLARNRPDALETLRRSLVGEVIDGASNDRQRRRLEGLQFKVDMARRRSATPLAATIKLSEMMCQSLADLHRSLITPVEELFGVAEEAVVGDRRGPVNRVQSAKILPFDRTIELDRAPDDF